MCNLTCFSVNNLKKKVHNASKSTMAVKSIVISEEKTAGSFIKDCILGKEYWNFKMKNLLFYFNLIFFSFFFFGCVGSSLLRVGFSLRGLLLLWSTGSRRAGFSSCGSQALERRFSSCGARA